MLVRHHDKVLQRLEADATFQAGHGTDVVKAFRKRMQFLRSCTSEQDMRGMKSLHFEKLKGKRAHQHSIRLNDQWRLILELEGEAPNKVVVVIAIEDYH